MIYFLNNEESNTRAKNSLKISDNYFLFLFLYIYVCFYYSNKMITLYYTKSVTNMGILRRFISVYFDIVTLVSDF